MNKILKKPDFSFYGSHLKITSYDVCLVNISLECRYIDLALWILNYTTGKIFIENRRSITLQGQLVVVLIQCKVILHPYTNWLCNSLCFNDFLGLKSLQYDLIQVEIATFYIYIL